MGSKCIAAVVVAAVAGAAGGYIKGHRDADQSAAVEAQAKRIRDLVAERDESDRIARQQQGNAENASKERDQVRVDADAAASAADGLRKQVSDLVERARYSAATPGGPATGDALDLLTDVLGRTDEAAGELARIADERGIAGRQCERSCDALIGDTRSNQPLYCGVEVERPREKQGDRGTCSNTLPGRLSTELG